MAEKIHARYCLDSPKEIDVIAIAYDLGVSVIYNNLDGCAATLVGYKDRAIATIRRSGDLPRDRFSIGHELGHWEMHRGQSFRCRFDEAEPEFSSSRELEQQANDFASHLLMPTRLFAPLVKQLGRPGFNELRLLGREFETSLVATCIRITKQDTLPVVVALYKLKELVWSLRSPHIPRKWTIRKRLDEDSYASQMLLSGTRIATPKKQPAEVWFSNSEAEEFEVFEHCTEYGRDQCLVILYLESAMFDDE